MSFAEKFSSLMARPGPDGVEKDDVPWWLKYAGRGLGTVGGFFAMLFGLWMAISITFLNILAAILQMLSGATVIALEAPCCCLCITFVRELSDSIETKPYWYKAIGYAIMAIPPIIMNPGLASIFGSGLIFATGVLYGMMALGRKGSSEDMRIAAMAAEPPVSRSSNMRSNLVDNAAPMSFTGPPITDSNV